ncbi:MAG: dihydroneopterin aldolase [Luteolibacter sp.]
MSDTIEIRKLRISTHIGVPDEERAEPQVVLLTIVMTPETAFRGLADDIARTVDYYAVSLELEALAAATPRKLIETLAADVADHLLGNHPLRRVDVMVEKFILPNTECVAVRTVRDKLA